MALSYEYLKCTPLLLQCSDCLPRLIQPNNNPSNWRQLMADDSLKPLLKADHLAEKRHSIRFSVVEAKGRPNSWPRSVTLLSLMALASMDDQMGSLRQEPGSRSRHSGWTIECGQGRDEMASVQILLFTDLNFGANYSFQALPKQIECRPLWRTCDFVASPVQACLHGCK